jgi:DNA replication and repair protein RecF
MIKTLVLTDFRNHKMSRINAGGARYIILCGPNGSGKTAVLESISVMSPGATLRGADASDISRIGGGHASVFCELADGLEISVTYTDGNSRRAKIGGDARPMSALPDAIKIIWLTPATDRLWTDAPAERRAFFDRLIGNFDAAHGGKVGRLQRLLSERSFALKNGGTDAWIDPIDRNIAALSVAIAAARIKYLERLTQFLPDIRITVNGILEDQSGLGKTAGDVESDFYNYLADNRCLTGDKMSIDGAHKSDFSAYLTPISMDAKMASTGQQKSALVAIISAHAKLLHAIGAKNLIVLLDEAASHLDKTALQKTMHDLASANAQIWMTSLHPAQYEHLPDSVFITCNDGKVVL